MRKLKQELIEKLRRGECVIDNTGNPDLELLRQLLKTVSPMNDRCTFGIGNYYGKLFTTKFFEGTNNIYSSRFLGWNNIILLKDFEEKELTELPNKWCVKGGDNTETIKSWFSTRLYRKVIGVKTNYYHFPEINPGTCSSGYIKEGYTEISFEDFKRLVLKKSNMKNRKIIGYKAPYDLFDHQVKKGDLYIKMNSTECVYFPKIQKRSNDYVFCMPDEIVKTWEPVYEEVLTLPVINGYEGKYDKSSNKIIYGCAEFPPNIFSFLKSANELCKNQSTRTIESITLSSGIKISIKDVYQINEFINGKE